MMMNLRRKRESISQIFAELLVVAAVLWMMVDTFWVDYRTYHAPLGFDIGNVWRFKLSNLDVKAPGYVPDSLYHSSDPEDLTQLMTQIRQNPEVEDVCVTFYSCPYSSGNSWREVKPVDGDTIYAAHMESFQMRNVTPEYFRLFRIRTVDGEPVYDKVVGRHNVIVITPEMAVFTNICSSFWVLKSKRAITAVPIRLLSLMMAVVSSSIFSKGLENRVRK